jgi:hypothetical protein
VFKPGFRPPADAVPSALGGEHCLGLWAELCGIAGVWNYAVCLNRDLNPLRLPSERRMGQRVPPAQRREGGGGGRTRTRFARARPCANTPSPSKLTRQSKQRASWR